MTTYGMTACPDDKYLFNRLLWIVNQADEQLGMHMSANVKQKLTLALAGGFKANGMYVRWVSELEKELGDDK